MCGLTGIWTGVDRGNLRRVVGAMSAALVHRGPDADGHWVDEEAGVALGHRRLAIVELSALGAQPMHSACGRYVLAFNGEIYNQLDIRRELEMVGKSPVWRGSSDTETILGGFSGFGLAATIEKCVGMFAMAIWDRELRELTLVRDRFGEKPLYYGWIGESSASRIFAFGSELKALRAHPAFDNSIDRTSLDLMLRYQAVPVPRSIYTHIRQLTPGCMLRLSLGDHASRHAVETPYWRLRDVARKGAASPYASEDEALKDLEAVLSQAIAGQMVADVPVGAFLSGGVDSSTIVALMQQHASRPVKTYTIGFDEAGFDEAPFAAQVAKHLATDHHELRVSAADALDVVRRLPSMYDEPFADSSQIPTSLICAMARNHVTVALSGDAGDEMFGGYNRYIAGPRIWRRVEKIPPAMRRVMGQALLALPAQFWDKASGMLPVRSRINLLGDKIQKLGLGLRDADSLESLYRSLIALWPPEQQAVLGVTPADRAGELDGFEEIGDPANRMMLWDAQGYLPNDILTKVDRAAMAVSLETRVPFLDHRVAEVAWRLPLAMKVRGGEGKWALRQILYKRVPRELIERQKAGFAVPVGAWLRGPLRDWAQALLDPGRLQREGYLDSAIVQQLWEEHLSGRRDWTARLWSILMFQAWSEAKQ